MQTVKEYVQIYPLEQFPLIKEFYNNLHSYSKGKDELWKLFINHSLESGFQVECRLVALTKDDNPPKQIYEAFISFASGPCWDWYYIGRSIATNEAAIVRLLEERTDRIFNIEDCNKEDMQKFLIQTLMDGDFSYCYLENELERCDLDAED